MYSGSLGASRAISSARCTQRRSVASSNWLQVAVPLRLPNHTCTASATLSVPPAVLTVLRA